MNRLLVILGMGLLSLNTVAEVNSLKVHYDCAYSLEAKNRQGQFITYQGQVNNLQMVLDGAIGYSKAIARIKYNDPLVVEIGLASYLDEVNMTYDILPYLQNVFDSHESVSGQSQSGSLGNPVEHIVLRAAQIPGRNSTGVSLGLRNLKVDCTLKEISSQKY